jgi:hypothetical protein
MSLSLLEVRLSVHVAMVLRLALGEEIKVPCDIGNQKQLLRSQRYSWMERIASDSHECKRQFPVRQQLKLMFRRTSYS